MAEITQNDITRPEADHSPQGRYDVNRVICQKGVPGLLMKSGTDLIIHSDPWPVRVTVQSLGIILLSGQLTMLSLLVSSMTLSVTS